MILARVVNEEQRHPPGDGTIEICQLIFHSVNPVNGGRKAGGRERFMESSISPHVAPVTV